MKNFTIPQPCSENFSLMTATERGAFCEKCATDTFDFRNKNAEEIKSILRSHVGQHICGRITPEQEAVLNAEFEQWSFKSTKSFQSAFLFTLIAVFGLGLFSCSDQRHEQEIINFQQTAKTILANSENAIAAQQEKKEDLELVQMVAKAPMDEMLEPELLQIDYAEIKEYTFNDVLIDQNEWYGSYGGAMVMSYAYEDFLLETIPYSVVEEFDAEGRVLPTAFSSLAFPNPTLDNSAIEIKVPVSGEFQIDLYDMNGKHQQEVYTGSIDRGIFRKEIEMRDLPPGMYLVTILSANYKETVRISKI